MRFGLFAAPAALLLAAVIPSVAQAESLTNLNLLNHAYYCETGGALAALDAGADIDAKTSGGFTALMTAALNDCEELARVLIERGADLGARSADNGQSALDIARINSPGIAAMIAGALGGGAPAPDNQPAPRQAAARGGAGGDGNGLRRASTPADRALLDHAYYCETDQALDALDAGANVDATTSGGFTALMTAALNECEDLADELIARGADLTARSADDGQSALDIARINDPNIAAMIEAALGQGRDRAGQPDGQPATAIDPPAPVGDPPARRVAGDEPAVADAAQGPAAWPPLGFYKPGQRVIHTDTGVVWTPGVVDRVMPDYGYVVGTDVPYRSGVAGVTREPFWTAWFIGDWQVKVPVSDVIRDQADGRYEVIIGGMHLPPLHIDADGTYAWRIEHNSQQSVIEGRWEPNPDAPGVILRNGEFGADWLVANAGDNSDEHDVIKLYTPKHTGYEGTRLQ